MAPLTSSTSACWTMYCAAKNEWLCQPHVAVVAPEGFPTPTPVPESVARGEL